MSDSLPYCRILGNADIAGIGIRASIYIQACLGPLFFFFSVLVGDFQQTETNSIELGLKRCKLLDEIGLTLLLTGTALITSTIIEAKTTDSGLSPYHALIVLNLSWLNNVTGFTLRLWSLLIKSTNLSKPINLSATKSYWAFILHCTMMSIVGIWFWANPNSFSHISDDHPCIPITYFWLFSPIPLPNDRLRIFSLIAYSAISIPIVNIIIHFFPWIFLTLVFLGVEGEVEQLGPWLFGLMVLSFLAISIGPTIFFITSTEMLIAANAEFVDHDVEEKWTFGQTLAIFLAAVSVFLILGNIREQGREARSAEMEKSGIGISRAAKGIAAMMLATQGRRVKARDVGPQILTPDELTPGV